MHMNSWANYREAVDDDVVNEIFAKFVWVNRKFNMEEERGMIPYLEETYDVVIVRSRPCRMRPLWPVQDWVWKRLCLLSAWTA